MIASLEESPPFDAKKEIIDPGYYLRKYGIFRYIRLCATRAIGHDFTFTFTLRTYFLGYLAKV